MECRLQHSESELARAKAQTQNEFLVKIGAKEEVIDWDPKIINERLHRDTSFVCAQYNKPACYRKKSKAVSVDPWRCDSQACRQLTLVTRFGPKNYFVNNPNIHVIGDSHLKGHSTQAFGLCYPPKTVDRL